jgi:SAM-dependent methyltransferase
MEQAYEHTYHSLEQDHFWFKSRRDIILRMMRSISPNAKILDVGCASGLLLSDLRRVGFRTDQLYGVDISERSIKNCQTRGLKNTFVMDAQDIRFNEKFDVIISSDTLEHLEQDQTTLNGWHDLLQPGGYLIVFVPAFSFLWSTHDVVNQHKRRYTLTDLRLKLKTAGFQIHRAGYWNFFLFFPIVMIRLLAPLAGKPGQAGDLHALPFGNTLLFNLLKLENRLLQSLRFPFGVSCFCLGQKIHNSSGNKKSPPRIGAGLG